MKEELAEFEEVALPADPRGTGVRPLIGGLTPSLIAILPAAAGDETEAAIKEEFGDLLFVMANIARHLKLDPEDALRAANAKFTRRFAYVEARLAAHGQDPRTIDTGRDGRALGRGPGEG